MSFVQRLDLIENTPSESSQKATKKERKIRQKDERVQEKAQGIKRRAWRSLKKF